MQATLLSIAIALILALVAALVGPHFVDWNKYRAEFEAQAGRMTGLQVRLTGPIEARLLPTPSIILQRIDITRPGHVGSVRARKLSIEFALGSLVRGEWKASDVRLEGAEISVVLDRDGRLEWPAPAIGFDPESISIERLDIRDSRALLADAGSGSSAVLDKIDFKGELRTLAGPIKGQGSFYLAGQHYPYRVTASRIDERLRVRLNVDPIDRPVTVDIEGFLSIENARPRFAGTVAMARPVTRAPSGSQAEILEPWRLTGRIDGTSSRAVIEQVEFQYGPDERPIRLRGDASVTFGASPRLTGVLSSSQVDLDRLLPESARRSPLAAIKAFADHFTGSLRLPIPVDLGVSIENLTLAGGTLQRFSGDFSTAPDGWTIRKLELRAPGLTQVAMAGRFGVSPDGISYAGRTRVESRDPRALMTWLTDRPDAHTLATTSLSIDGEFKLGGDEIAVDRLKAELDRVAVEGRLSYAWGRGDRPPRVEAVVSAPDIDLDRAYGVLRNLFDGTGFDWPREGLVSASIGRATLAGVAALRANVNMRFNAHGFDIERLAIGDFGGAALEMKGNIDMRAKAPRGSLTLDLDGRRLDGVTALLERISPPAAAELRRHAARLSPAKLGVTLNVRPGTAAVSSGQFKIAGSAGAFLVSLHGELGVGSEDLTIANLARLLSAKVDLGGELAARDGSALVTFLGLERLVAVDQGSGRLSVTARGQLDSDLAVEGQLVAGGLDVAAAGRVRLAGSQGLTAGMDVRVERANLRALRTGSHAMPLVTTLTTKLSLAEGVIGLTDLSGKVAGTDVGGRLTIGLAEPVSIGGELSLGAASLPAAIAAAIGMPLPAEPPTRAGEDKEKGAAWPAEPFEPGLIGSMDGAIKLRIGRLAVSPLLEAQDIRGVLQFGRESLAVEDIDGAIAGGRVTGAVNFKRGAEGLALGGRMRFAGVNIAEFLPGDGALAGTATLDLDLSGTGRSAIALIGSLRGEGTFTVQDGRIRRVDSSAFEAVIRSVDQGLPIDPARIRVRMEAALDTGALNVEQAQGEIAIASGHARLANTAVQAKGAELRITAGFDLAAGAIDARLSLAAANGAGPPEPVRPEVVLVLRGPIGAPRRTLDVVAFTNWLALRAIEEKDKHIEALEAQRESSLAPAAPAEPPAAAPAPEGTNSVLETPSQQPKQRAMPPRPPAAKAPPQLRPPPHVNLQMPSRQPAQPSTSPASRSWLDNLFGP